MKILLWITFIALFIGPIPYVLALSQDSQKALVSGMIWMVIVRQIADNIIFKHTDNVGVVKFTNEKAKD